MSNEVTGGQGVGQPSAEFETVNEFGHEDAIGAKEGPEAHIRAARAKLIEETTYRLTDLFTIVSARIELLGERVPASCREELSAIRKFLLHGVELNKRLYLVAEACRRGTGAQK